MGQTCFPSFVLSQLEPPQQLHGIHVIEEALRTLADKAALPLWDCPALVDGLRAWELCLGQGGLHVSFVGYGRAIAQAGM